MVTIAILEAVVRRLLGDSAKVNIVSRGLRQYQVVVPCIKTVALVNTDELQEELDAAFGVQLPTMKIETSDIYALGHTPEECLSSLLTNFRDNNALDDDSVIERVSHLLKGPVFMAARRSAPQVIHDEKLIPDGPTFDARSAAQRRAEEHHERMRTRREALRRRL